MTIQDIIFILDQSGSMMTMGDEPRQALNKFVKDQKKDKDGATFTLYTFDTHVKRLIDETLLQDVQEVETLEPGGLTALYDAIGIAINNKMEQEKNKDVICVILTDGLENSSFEYNIDGIKSLTTRMETQYGWEFIYLGTNQDSFIEGHKVGISTCMDYESSPDALRNAVNVTSVGISDKRMRSRKGETNTRTNLSIS